MLENLIKNGEYQNPFEVLKIVLEELIGNYAEA